MHPSLPPKPPQSLHAAPEPPQHNQRHKRKQERQHRQRDNRRKSSNSSQQPGQKTAEGSNHPGSSTGQQLPKSSPKQGKPGNEDNGDAQGTVVRPQSSKGRTQTLPEHSDSLGRKTEKVEVLKGTTLERGEEDNSNDLESSAQGGRRYSDTDRDNLRKRDASRFEADLAVNDTLQAQINHDREHNQRQNSQSGSASVRRDSRPDNGVVSDNNTAQMREPGSSSSRDHRRHRYSDASHDDDRHSKRPRRESPSREDRSSTAKDNVGNSLRNALEQLEPKPHAGPDSGGLEPSLPSLGSQSSRFAKKGSRGSRSSSVSSRSSDLNSLEAELLGRPVKQTSASDRDERSRKDRNPGPKHKRRRQANADSAYR